LGIVFSKFVEIQGKGGFVMAGKYLLIDTSLCISCRACQVACKKWHKLPPIWEKDVPQAGDTQTNWANCVWKDSVEPWNDLTPINTPPLIDNELRTDLTGTTFTIVKEREAEVNRKVKKLIGGSWSTSVYSKLTRLFFKDQCHQCINPFCMGACPLKAIERDIATGAVVITDACDINLCPTLANGKHPCEVACPYHIPRINNLKGKATKCDFCYDRIRDGSGRKTSCAEACPADAVMFGGYKKINDLATTRLKKAKKRYPDANLYQPYPSRVWWILVTTKDKYGL
jgi:formate dehydrogenase iron-sulfur subunit